MKRTALIVIVFIAGVSAIGIGLTRRLVRTEEAAHAGTPAGSSTGRGLTIKLSDRPVPMPAMTLTSLNDRPVSAEALKGKVVLLNFWATWCGPCRAEIPDLVALQERYRDRLVVVGLSTDERPADEVKKFADDLKVNYPIVMANAEIEQAFGGISSLPSTFVVNPAGQVVMRHVGMLNAELTEHEVRALSGLPTEATVQTVKDTGQVLLTNAAYATEIPGVDLKPLTPLQREAALKRMNTEHCTCGCNLTIAQCRINDPGCEISLPIAKGIAKEAAAGPKQAKS